MKWLFFFLSAYIMALSGIPCSADDGCCMEETRMISKSTCNDKDERPKAPCSPFFACGACHGVTLPAVANIAIPYFVPTIIERLSFYQERTPSEWPSAIWQPPKMC